MELVDPHPYTKSESTTMWLLVIFWVAFAVSSYLFLGFRVTESVLFLLVGILSVQIMKNYYKIRKIEKKKSK